MGMSVLCLAAKCLTNSEAPEEQPQATQGGKAFVESAADFRIGHPLTLDNEAPVCGTGAKHKMCLIIAAVKVLDYRRKR
jgi:hypothetical protein